MWYPCYIIDGKTDRLVQHSAKDDVTQGGITWDSLQDIRGANGEVWYGDKPWYADHDVDYDVPLCEFCTHN